MTKESQKWAEAYTGIPTYNYYSEIYKNLSSDSRIISMQNNVKDMRKELEDEIAKLRSLRMIEA